MSVPPGAQRSSKLDGLIVKDLAVMRKLKDCTHRRLCRSYPYAELLTLIEGEPSCLTLSIVRGNEQNSYFTIGLTIASNTNTAKLGQIEVIAPTLFIAPRSANFFWQ